MIVCIYMVARPNFSKTKRGANGKFLPKPLLFHLRHPNSKTNEPKFWQILSPKNSFAKTSSVLKPHALPEYLEGRTPKKNVLSISKKKFTLAKSKKQETFFFGVAGVLASAWGFLRAYDLVSSHHALRACHIICFESKCELGTIKTPKWNLAVENQPRSVRAEGTPTLFRPFSPMNSGFGILHRLRRCGGVSRQAAGASQRFLWHRPFSQKGLNQKQFCPRIERLLASFGKVRANHSACVKERSFLPQETSWKVTVLIFQCDNLAHQSLGRDNL